MREFFRGWRRKFGVMTLVMACVFAAGWVRSISIVDGLTIPSYGDTTPTVWSGNQLIVLENVPREFTFGDHTLKHECSDFAWYNLHPLQVGQQTSKIAWKISILGFGVGNIEGMPETTSTSIDADGNLTTKSIGAFSPIHFRTVSYWSIVIPLTLLSAYLLLSKPRVAKKQPDEGQVTHA